MKKIKKIWPALAGVVTTVVASSAMAVAPLPTGWYLEGNVGSSKVNDVNFVANSSLTNTGVAGNLNLGYKFIPFFATELGYTRYSDSTSKVNGVKVATTKYYSYDIAAKPLLPIGDTGMELFAKLGVAHLNSNVSNSNTTYTSTHGIVVTTGTSNVNGYYFGLGADYSFMPAVAVNGQWQRAKGNSRTGTQNLYSIGISYLFG